MILLRWFIWNFRIILIKWLKCTRMRCLSFGFVWMPGVGCQTLDAKRWIPTLHCQALNPKRWKPFISHFHAFPVAGRNCSVCASKLQTNLGYFAWSRWIGLLLINGSEHFRWRSACRLGPFRTFAFPSEVYPNFHFRASKLEVLRKLGI